MNKHLLPQFLTIVTLILISCGGNAPVSTPAVDPSAVAAVVSTILAGNSTATPLPQPTATFTPEPPTVLPRSLYYLAQDGNGKEQIFRLGRDGATITQITFEQVNISDFDISPLDGTIAYIVGDNLTTMNANGQNRQALVQDSNIGFRLVWSPDGKTIVYGYPDVVFYSPTLGTKDVIISGKDAKYWPAYFSPDGSRLIVWEKPIIPSAPGSEPVFIYDFNSRTLTSASDCSGRNISWNTSDSIFCYKYVFAGGGSLGLSQVNAMDGSAKTLIFSEICPPCLPIAAPRFSADGNLYYLYAEVNDVTQTYPSLSLVYSVSDDISSRQRVRPESFNVLNTLWAPNGDGLLIVQNNGNSSFPTNILLVSIEPSLPIVTVIPDASKINPYSLRWGP